MIICICIFLPPIISVILHTIFNKKLATKKETALAYLIYTALIFSVTSIARIILFRQGEFNYLIVFESFSTVSAAIKYLLLALMVSVTLPALRWLVLPNVSLIKDEMPKRTIWLSVLCAIIVLVSNLLFCSARWYINVFGKTGFDSVLFTLIARASTASSEMITSFIEEGLIGGLIRSALWLLLLLLINKSRLVISYFSKLRVRMSTLVCLMGLIYSAVSIWQASEFVGMREYIVNITHHTTLFEDYYISPREVKITFPEKKRNLIYIFCESMETTFFSEEHGGARPYMVIPELYEIAKENVNFSNNEDVGGAVEAPGMTWTIASMVAQTGGIPLKLPDIVDENEYGINEKFLPGLVTSMEVLHENGYVQALMLGSSSEFGGILYYYSQHGTDHIYDLHTARKEIVPENYFEWWGIEDEKLFEYAKMKLSDLSKENAPFAFSMMTIDTHPAGGYYCHDCPDVYDEQYENVFACSSKRLADFLKWIEKQDFFENTTVIITGDHCSMDAGYFSRIGLPETYTRHIYNCVVNPMVIENAKNYKNRVFTVLDMFPTTLASIGCKIEGDRLGLGTNLFSELPTIAEENGIEWIESELAKSSSYYLRNFQ